MPNRVLTSSGGPRHSEMIGPKICPHVKHGRSSFFLELTFSQPPPQDGLQHRVVMLSYSLSKSSFADSKWSHKCDGSPQIGLFRMPCSCIFYNDREHFNPAQTRRFCYAISFSISSLASSSFTCSVISEEATVKIQFYRLETSTPQQRPAATKWLQ